MSLGDALGAAVGSPHSTVTARQGRLTVKAAKSPLSGRLQPSHISASNAVAFSPMYIRTCTDADISSPVPSHTAVYSGVDCSDATSYSFMHTDDVGESLY